MSNVHFSIVKVSGVSENSDTIQALTLPAFGTSETVSSDVTSKWTSLTANAATLGTTDPSNFVWRVAVGGTDDVYVAFVATSTTVTAANGFLCPAGGVYEFSINAVGSIVGGVINA